MKCQMCDGKGSYTVPSYNHPDNGPGSEVDIPYTCARCNGSGEVNTVDEFTFKKSLKSEALAKGALRGYIRFVGHEEGVDFIPDKYEEYMDEFMSREEFQVLKEAAEEARGT